ncbi:MAG: M20/M25/M40 family metallo-hydrolase [Candidatus Marinimicrobia bacterium]|nr:M20/M25/M40 family metallo-hydrolase [Candidatus Neomarinimicrobiota bacterium]MCF7850087.1 M20/M25/M40 family metallo-hydrolase [Candidatus Neomarinimicrobiota bacterium]MCF7904852.1 M20/M25/M40 family metallo-hydrolase [Candidatus Neomarinimicrobiota bacterium]
MNRSIILLTSLLLLGCSSFLPQNDTPISSDEIRDHIAYLASDALEGRKPGTPGGKAAADYVAEHFKQIGLTPLGQDGFQSFEVVTKVSLGADNSLTAGKIMGVPGQDYTPTSFSENASLEAGLVFVGYGFEIDSDTLKWNDYLTADTQDKWVLILRGSPETEDNALEFGRHATLRHKLLVARDHGAAGVVFVSGTKFDEQDELIELRIERNFSKSGLPVIHVTRDLADRLLADDENTIADLEALIDSKMKPKSFITRQRLAVNIEVVQHEVTTQNVIGVLEGSDPVLKDEYLLVGGHYDHLGWGGKGSGSRKPDTSAIHNGADDNASGVAAVLEIAEKFAQGSDTPKRSIIFMAFAAEEMGLLGSKHFTSNPLVKLEQIKQMFNLDMVGRLDDERRILTAGGTGTAEGMEDLLDELASSSLLRLSKTPDGYGPSDHASFYVEDIPVLFFFTGITEEYHTPGDDLETINIEGEQLIAEFTYDLVLRYADLDETFIFQEAGPKGPPKSGKRGKVKMGIIPDFAAADANGFLLGGVVPGGPAAIAGMKKGDVMVSLEGRSVKNIYDYMGRMADVKPGMRISVEVLRDGEKLILIVQL